MKRIIARAHGAPQVMKIEEVELRSLEPNEIKVRNHAIGVNYTDVYTRQGNETYIRGKEVEAYTPGKELRLGHPLPFQSLVCIVHPKLPCWDLRARWLTTLDQKSVSTHYHREVS